MNEPTDAEVQAAREARLGVGVLCRATTRAGTRCRAPVLKGGHEFCFMHSPSAEAARKASSAKGGDATARKHKFLLGQLAFGTPAQVVDARMALAAAVIQGQVAPNRAAVVVGIIKDAEASIAGARLEERLVAMEATLAALAR